MAKQDFAETEGKDLTAMKELLYGELFKTSILKPALTEAVADEIERRRNECFGKDEKSLEHSQSLVNYLMRQNAHLIDIIRHVTGTKESDRFERVQKNATTSKSVQEEDENTKEIEWRYLADNEIDEGRKKGYGHKHGTHTVLCIDTSDSMNDGNAWAQVKMFYDEYLDGIQQLKDQEGHYDNIAVVTFGGETKVRQRLTKNLDNLRGILDNITPSGPSPIFGGLLIAGAVAKTSRYSFAMVNNLLVVPKVILVTDGRPTELTLRNGPDVADPCRVERTKTAIIDEAFRLAEDKIDLHCIYVGHNSDHSFLRKIQNKSVRKLMSYRDGEDMALYTILKVMKEGDQRFVQSAGSEAQETLIKKMGLSHIEKLSDMPKESVSDQTSQLLSDLKTLCSILGEDQDTIRITSPDVTEIGVKTSTITMAGDRLVNVYKEINDGKHPVIGMRVEVGSDWIWGNQNKGKDGTIVGHATDLDDNGQCWVHVEWDNDSCPERGTTNVYRYKMDDDMEGDVRKAANEDRVPPEGNILAVGCRVKEGEGFPDQKHDMKGTVIRFYGRNRVQVRWDDGRRGKYHFGSDPSEVVPLMNPERTSFIPTGQEDDTEQPVSEDGNGVPNIIVTENYIKQFAQTITKGWDELGFKLGILNTEILRIKNDPPDSIEQKTSAMLHVWKRNAKLNNYLPTLDVVVKAIRGCNKVEYWPDALSGILEAARKNENDKSFPIPSTIEFVYDKLT